MRISRAQALSWRLRRQFLADGAASAEAVVSRLGAVPAISGDAELAVRRRMSDPVPGAVAAALRNGRLMKTYAFRGATNLMTPADAGIYLVLRAASRMWELPSWVEYYELQPRQWPALREVVRDLVADGPLTRAQLTAGVTASAGFGHLGPGFNSPSDTFVKAFHWQGDLCFGPSRDGQTTFQSPGANPGWGGIPDLEDAGRTAVAAYFDAYGPATPEHLHYWLGSGLSAGRKRITGWLNGLADELVEIDVDGETMLHAERHLDGLVGQAESTAVTLLAGYDQWVLGPGTADERIVSPKRRTVATRGANLVLVGGVVSGTWKADTKTLAISWFAEAGDPPGDEIDAEATRLAALLDRDLTVTVDAV